jgi:hypothetical protein
MALSFFERARRALACFACAGLLIAAAASPAQAQPGGLADAILALWNNSSSANGVREVDGFLFGARVGIRVVSPDGSFDPKRLRDNDRVTRFEIGRGNDTLRFPGGTAREFSDWVRSNKSAVTNILFPTSVSESVSGRDAAQNHAQQFLFNTAMAISAAQQTDRATRAGSGGLFEVENLTGEGRSTLAFQGLYRFQGAHMSVIGRYSQQREGTQSPLTAAPLTQSLSLATDFHPSLSVNQAVDWRIGIDARTGVLMTWANTVRFGSIDYGGGVWTSAQKDFSRVRVGVGSLLQASKSHVPFSINGDLESLVDEINHKAPAWDASYGAIAGYALTKRTSLNGKVLQTQPLQDAGGFRAPTTIVMGSVSHLIGGLTPVDIGYKHTTSGAVHAHGVFVQGNYGW